MSVTTWQDVHEFWFGELADANTWDRAKMKQWYTGGPSFDALIMERFGDVLESAARGERDGWKESARGQLSLILLFDQFTRNVYRGSGMAFQHDALALTLAQDLIDSGRVEELHPIERVFVFMPLEHAEDIALQDRCVELFEELATVVDDSIRDVFENFAEYARKHREIIARFGRFPHRNALLERDPTPDEEAYLEHGGETFGQKKG